MVSSIAHIQTIFIFRMHAKTINILNSFLIIVHSYDKILTITYSLNIFKNYLLCIITDH